jgi:hypothetical protein
LALISTTPSRGKHRQGTVDTFTGRSDIKDLIIFMKFKGQRQFIWNRTQIVISFSQRTDGDIFAGSAL